MGCRRVRPVTVSSSATTTSWSPVAGTRLERARANEKIKGKLNSQITGVVGDTQDGSESTLDVSGFFVAIDAERWLAEHRTTMRRSHVGSH